MKMLVILTFFQAALSAVDDELMRGWIEALSSDDIEQRARASKNLLEAGEKAVPLLTKALDREDLELRIRCQCILAHAVANRKVISGVKVEAGARKLAGVGTEVPAMCLNETLKKEFDGLLAAGKTSEILKRDHVWLTKGAVWVDDVSLAVEGKEILKNGGFEDK